MTVAIIYREELKEYDFGPGHPFRGDRYTLFHQFLRENLPEDDNYRIVKADWASDEDLLLICRNDYITFTREYFKAASLGMDHPGPFHQFHSGDNLPTGKPGRLEEAARLVVGQAKTACDSVQKGEFEKAVCVGGGLHHAKPSYGEGFCLYNDVAFCARYLLQQHGLQRVLILDTDAHAGNGTAEYFYDDPSVLLIDVHQDPRTLYPGTGFAHEIGSGDGKGFTINIPMPVYSGCDSYKLAFEELVQPIAEEFRPQIIIRNGGSDPHFSDGLTNLGLPVEGFRMIGEKVREMAKSCQGKTIDLIASGYNRDVLPYAWLALISGLAGFKTDVDEPEAIPQRFRQGPSLTETGTVVEEVKSCLREYWRCLR
ncbi:MAG: histone deacetylase family protein [Dehalococcoidia bacterium]